MVIMKCFCVRVNLVFCGIMNNVIYFDIGISKCLNFTKHVAGIATMIKRTGADCGLSTLMILVSCYLG